MHAKVCWVKYGYPGYMSSRCVGLSTGGLYAGLSQVAVKVCLVMQLPQVPVKVCWVMQDYPRYMLTFGGILIDVSYLRAQSQEHHTIDRLEERGIESGSAQRSSLRGQERSIYRQSDQHWKCFKGNIGETHERRVGLHMGFPERIDTILNLNELN